MGSRPGTDVCIQLKDINLEKYSELCKNYSENILEQPFTGDVDDYCIDEILEDWLYVNTPNSDVSIGYYSSHYDGESVYLRIGVTYGYEDSTSLEKINLEAENLKELVARPFIKELFNTTDSPIEVQSTYG